MTCRIVVAEPRHLAREAIGTALDEQPDLEVVAACAELTWGMLHAVRTDAQILVLASSLVCDLSTARDQLQAGGRPPRTLVVDPRRDEATLRLAIEAGADAYVGGEDGLTGLVEAIRACERGESVVPPSMLGPLLRSLIDRDRESHALEERWERLTPREREVMALMAGGRSPAEIAEQLVIGLETARTHIQRVLRKLDVHSRAEAIAVASRTGLIDRLARSTTSA